MKSVIQAIWLFTVAIGDVIVVVVVESIHIENLVSTVHTVYVLLEVVPFTDS